MIASVILRTEIEDPEGYIREMEIRHRGELAPLRAALKEKQHKIAALNCPLSVGDRFIEEYTWGYANERRRRTWEVKEILPSRWKDNGFIIRAIIVLRGGIGKQIRDFDERRESFLRKVEVVKNSS